PSSKASLRRALYTILESNRMSEDGESLLDTYEVLLRNKPVTARPQACPYEDCPRNDAAYEPQQGVFACSCDRTLRQYSTDALRIQERMVPTGRNARIYSKILQVFERLWMVHILRTLESTRLLPSLGKLAIMLDGPLAVFGQPAWISTAISHEL